MATLHIEHPITDLTTWLGAFARFEQARRNAGVRSQTIHQPVDDDKYIYIRLEFDTVEQANVFKSFLETNVWSSREASAWTWWNTKGAGTGAGGSVNKQAVDKQRYEP